MPGLTLQEEPDVAALAASWPCTRIVRSPLALVDRLFSLQPYPASSAAPPSSSSLSLASFLRHQLALPASLPSPASSAPLSSVPRLIPGSSPPSSLVRVRGIVQDTGSAAYYLAAFTMTAGRQGTGRCRDAVAMAEDEELNDSRSVFRERMNVRLLAVTGENSWVQQILDANANDASGAAETGCDDEQKQAIGSRKRQLQQEHDDSDDDSDDHSMALETTRATDGPDTVADSTKRARRETEPTVDVSSSTSVSNPGGCIVTVSSRLLTVLTCSCCVSSASHRPLPCCCCCQLYDEDVGSLKVGDVVEVIGVYSLTPHLISDDGDGLHDNAEHCNHHVHCIAYVRYTSSFPLPLPSSLSASDLSESRASLLSHLTAVCSGDRLTASLLLLSVLSRVHSRAQEAVVGKLTVNVTSPADGFVSALSSFLSLLLPHSVVLPLTLPALNAAPLFPTKCYDTDRISASPLLLPSGSLLLVDGTGLTAGALTAVGERNLSSLSVLLSQQQLQYDFVYHQLALPVDVNAVIVSPSRSLLPSALHLPMLTSQPQPQPAPAAAEGALTAWRQYVAVTQQGEVSIGKEVGAAVESLYVRRRKDAAVADGERWLHAVLLVSRLLAVSWGEKELTQQRLMEAVEMVDAVNTRLSSAQPLQ